MTIKDRARWEAKEKKFKMTVGQGAYFIWGSFNPENATGLHNAGFLCVEDALRFYKEHRTAIIKHFSKTATWESETWDTIIKNSFRQDGSFIETWEGSDRRFKENWRCRTSDSIHTTDDLTRAETGLNA